MKNIKKCAILLGIIKEDIANRIIAFLSNNEKISIIEEIERNDTFSKAEKNEVLLDFNKHFNDKKKPVFTLELITLLIITSSIIGMYLLYLLLNNSSSSFKLYLKLIANYGGIYLLGYPYLSYFTRISYGISPFKLVFKGKHFFQNLFIGIIGSVILFGLLVVINRLNETSFIMPEKLFYFVLLIQGVFAPLTEEIFFKKKLLILKIN